jgi:hypothetical protein
MGAPVGNQNGSKGRQWSEAVKRAIRAKYGKEWEQALQDLASKLVDAADGGDLQALKEVGDRLDGKPKQIVEQSGLDGEPIKTSLTVEFVGSVPGQT